MKLEKFKKLVNDCGTEIKKVWQDSGQDPFVLYDNRYKLKEAFFPTIKALQKFFEGKKVVFKETQDPWTIKYWIQKDVKRPSEALEESKKNKRTPYVRYRCKICNQTFESKDNLELKKGLKGLEIKNFLDNGEFAEKIKDHDSLKEVELEEYFTHSRQDVKAAGNGRIGCYTYPVVCGPVEEETVGLEEQMIDWLQGKDK